MVRPTPTWFGSCALGSITGTFPLGVGGSGSYVLGPRELPTVAIAIAQRVNEQVRSVMIGMGERTKC